MVAGDDFEGDGDDSEDGSDDETSPEEGLQENSITGSPSALQQTTHRIPPSGEWTDVIPPLFGTGHPTGSRRFSVPPPTTSRVASPNRYTPFQPWTAPEGKEAKVPFQILHTSVHDLCLFVSEGDTRVLCDYILYQRVPPRLRGLTTFERLNMIHQIPELGVIVVGSQIGRVAVLTLTRLKRRNPALSGFRLDWILPLKSQEDRGVRPEAPLMGISASPVQGHENPDAIDDEVSSPNGDRRSLRSDLRKYRVRIF